MKSYVLSSSFVLTLPSLSISKCMSRHEVDISVSVVSFIYLLSGIYMIDLTTNPFSEKT